MTLEKLVDLVSTAGLLTKDSLEQAGGLIDRWAGNNALPSSEDAKKAVEYLKESVRDNLGYSWWLKLDWETCDGSGKVTPHTELTRYHGQYDIPADLGNIGIYGGQTGGKVTLRALQDFEKERKRANGLTGF
jgi:hypothetical protein